MEIYLIRHTTPAVAKGTCYGQTDLDLTDSLSEEAAVIRRHLPAGIVSVHSSPLRRCARLAEYLFPAHTVRLHPDLMEIHCGHWEMKHWDELPKEDLDPWMKDFVQLRIPGGESYLDLFERVNHCYRSIRDGQAGDPGGAQAAGDAIAIISHGGPIRSILSEMTNTPLIDSFKVFSLHYGCVVRLSDEGGVWRHEVLSNPVPAEKEQHKPKNG
ncbi:MAG: alpha-ribazole phosphatase family protein [Bacteroidota bacterium]|nr:alpha-ribazole phosphatase family protein [Bacteroidota bacterium]MDP4217293.1 alpha-ribazole phosphatase family protein [Bacteroidota bacterium]MDP4246168.1 alpha-ribazole phosphatase family protein [Bacteroidota bacterium]MDP4253975.1 alpha-ribazole phosphatase family protein [Bacteroidota bacterium]MDP4257993.1 alpha-ribazole phosphatase family protein [Bacteroidota bacterium]